MKNLRKRLLICCLAAAAWTALAGCGKKSGPGKESTEVLKLTIAPEVTPTPAPEQVDARAVEKNGSLMMINEYLLRNPEEIGKADKPDETDKEAEGEYDGEE